LCLLDLEYAKRSCIVSSGACSGLTYWLTRPPLPCGITSNGKTSAEKVRPRTYRERALGHESVLVRDPLLDFLIGSALTGWLLLSGRGCRLSRRRSSLRTLNRRFAQSAGYYDRREMIFGRRGREFLYAEWRPGRQVPESWQLRHHLSNPKSSFSPRLGVSRFLMSAAALRSPA